MVNHQIRKVIPELLKQHFSHQFLNNQTHVVIGYGSGVFPQTAKPTQNTIDLLIVTRQSQKAHQQILRGLNSCNDYSGLAKILGSNYLDLLNRRVFPAHFNHPIVQGTKIKYGIIDKNVFQKDLLSWNMLSFAGRLHKPVWFDILGHNPSQYNKLLATNHRMALAVTLLRLITKINDKQTPLSFIYEQITNMSYLGDIRHSFSVQNANKTKNIVNHNYGLFQEIYYPLLQKLASSLSRGSKAIQLKENSIFIHYTPQLIMKLTHPMSLPITITNHLQKLYPNDNKALVEHILMGGAGELTTQINKCVAMINKKSSTWMAIQNFLGASLIDNFNYVLAKIKKRNQK